MDCRGSLYVYIFILIGVGRFLLRAGHRNALQFQTFCICYREPEKHLWRQDAVDTLLYGPVAKGVQKFRTPLGYTLSRTR